MGAENQEEVEDLMELTRENYNAWIAEQLRKRTPKDKIIAQLRELDGNRPRTPETYERYVQIVKDAIKRREM